MSSHQPSATVGIDLGDRHSHLCILDTRSGEVVEESRVPTSPRAFERRFDGHERMRVVVEAGEPTRRGSAGSWSAAATRCWWPTPAS